MRDKHPESMETRLWGFIYIKWVAVQNYDL